MIALEPRLWFAGQLLLLGLSFVIARRLRGLSHHRMKIVAVVATALMLFWPLIRFQPSLGIDLFGARSLTFIEVTGITLPAMVLFTLAAKLTSRERDQRALRLMPVIVLLYLFATGRWMLAPPIATLPPMKFSGDVCLQTTGYSCVAASLVTLLRAVGIDATETEMARLSLTEENGGTTDTRAAYALQCKLADRGWTVHYDRLDYARLQSLPKPCLTPLRWGYFFNHMVPVLAADDRRVTLGDPLTGRRVMSADDFQAEWLGRAIYVLRP